MTVQILGGCLQAGSATHDAKAGSRPATTAPAPSSANSTKSCLNLVNGQAIAEGAYPAVVHIIRDTGDGKWSSCTGTFVSPTAVITAGHCTSNSNNQIAIIYGAITPEISTLSASQIVAKLGGVSATNLFNLGYTEELSTDSNGSWTPSVHDVAIVMFPEGTAKGIMPIAKQRPTLGTTITLVGYGDSTLQNQKQAYSYLKRAGTNVIAAPPPNETQDPTLILAGGDTAQASAAAGGSEALGTFGDSGGPMIVDNQLAATFRSQTWLNPKPGSPTVYYNQFIDINSPQTQRLISSANQAGANIPAPGTTSQKDLASPSDGLTGMSSDGSSQACTH